MMSTALIMQDVKTCGARWLASMQHGSWQNSSQLMLPMHTCNSPSASLLRADSHENARGSLQHVQTQRRGRLQVKGMYLEAYCDAVV